jgi:uncharacterized protein YggE
MNIRTVAILLCAAVAPQLPAQQTTRRLVRVIGEASVSVRPDSARITVSVVKQATTAAAAAADNATTTTAVIAALRQLLGPNADVRTAGYNLSPIYARDNNNVQRITGYAVSNTVQAVANDPSLAGRVVDAAIAAGASRVDSVSLFLRDEEPSRIQALRMASQKARTKADAVALGLGVRLGTILMAQETAVSPAGIIPIARIEGPGATAVVTPIEAGTLEVRATVTLDVEIAP